MAFFSSISNTAKDYKTDFMKESGVLSGITQAVSRY